MYKPTHFQFLEAENKIVVKLKLCLSICQNGFSRKSDKKEIVFLNFPAASKAHLKKETVLFIRALYRLENRAAIFRVPLLSKGVPQGHRGEIVVMPLFFHDSYKLAYFPSSIALSMQIIMW